MPDKKNVIKWSELHGLNVTIPSAGKNVGTVEDFYFQQGTNSINALRIHTRLAGTKALPTNVIGDIVKDAVIIPSAEMLTVRLPPFPAGSSLLNATVKGENGKEVGTVTEILISTVPLNALRVVGYEVVNSSKKRKTVGAHAVLHYDENLIIIDNQTVSGL